MLPTLAPGDLVWVDSAPSRLPSVGDLVVVQDPGVPKRYLIKRVASLGERTFSVSSDSPVGARDSRQFGSLTEDHLLGVVLRTVDY